MSQRSRSWLIAFGVLSAATALAEDVHYENPYAMKKGRAKDEAVEHVDPAFAKTLVVKLAACYREEQERPVSVEERALLDAYGKDLARELAPAFTALGCAIGKPASAACAQLLDTLSCETLAQPIIAAGWDRHLPAEAKQQVASYAKLLAAREATCSGRAADEQAIIGGIQVDKLRVLIEAAIVTGRCELMGEQQAACAQKLGTFGCGQLASMSERGELIQACDKLLRCRELPVDPS